MLTDGGASSGAEFAAKQTEQSREQSREQSQQNLILQVTRAMMDLQQLQWECMADK